MHLLTITIEQRVIIGISAMVLLFASFLIAFINSQRRKLLYHKNLHALNQERQELLTQQNANLEESVKARTLELSQQKEQLQKSLNDLKTTQLQLVQKEKMASLGEMAAGIAHEIQNPLNFVNNFSEVSGELTEELEKSVVQHHWEDAVQLSKGLKENLSKIIRHGKRAEAIVRNMLQHSRASSERKEPIDINDLADEYLHLAYHTMRTKYKGFDAELQTQFDGSLEKVSVYPQDIGRVLVNLYNNAFYSLQQKKRLQNGHYHPVITVCTKKLNNKIAICVKDNGTGIPQTILNKIYQPFFTTKPAGEGTGLGLSLSYDIVTKSHGGELMVETREGEGAEFIVLLPMEK